MKRPIDPNLDSEDQNFLFDGADETSAPPDTFENSRAQFLIIWETYSLPKKNIVLITMSIIIITTIIIIIHLPLIRITAKDIGIDIGTEESARCRLL